MYNAERNETDGKHFYFGQNVNTHDTRSVQFHPEKNTGTHTHAHTKNKKH